MPLSITVNYYNIMHSPILKEVPLLGATEPPLPSTESPMSYNGDSQVYVSYFAGVVERTVLDLPADT